MIIQGYQFSNSFTHIGLSGGRDKVVHYWPWWGSSHVSTYFKFLKVIAKILSMWQKACEWAKAAHHTCQNLNVLACIMYINDNNSREPM